MTKKMESGGAERVEEGYGGDGGGVEEVGEIISTLLYFFVRWMEERGRWARECGS